MIVVEILPAVSKRELGLAFCLSAGALFSGILLANGTIAMRTATTGATVGVLSGIVPSMAFASTGCWLPRTRLTDDQIWRVAAWGGFGIAVLTAVDVGIVLVHFFIQPIVDVGIISLMGHVGVGGVVGVLVGTARELNVNARRLHERNTVMNRILRHNLRNDINVIQGSTKLIRDGRGDPVKHADRITGKVTELMKISEQVRRMQETTEPDRLPSKPVDVVEMVEERLTLLERTHPEVSITKSLPDEASVEADQLLGAIVDNVFENAIDHNDGRPEIVVEVSRAEVDGLVNIIISDNGPGVPESELEVLEEGRETPLLHSTGTGLWLVKWYVEQNGGRLRIATSSSGTTVKIELPGVNRRLPDGGPIEWARWFVGLTRV